MALHELPLEVLEKILLLLPPSDRLNCAVTCRSIANAATHSSLLDDVWFVIHRVHVRKIMPVISASRRQYRNLRLHAANLSYNILNILTLLGEHVCRLEIVVGNNFESAVFYSILRILPKLESLDLVGNFDRHEPLMPIEPPEEADLVVLLNVRHFGTNFEMTPKLLDFLLGEMPNLTSLKLRYDRGYSLSESPLDLFRANPMLTKLDLMAVEVLEINFLTELAQMFSRSLQELRLSCRDMTSEAYIEIVKFRELRLLILNRAYELTDNALEQLVRNNPNLETLAITHSHKVGDGAVAHICALKKLRSLDLTDCKNISKDSLRGLAMIETMQHLKLRKTKFDTSDIQVMACLEHLRSLELNQVSPETFNVICESCKWLKTFAVNCRLLNDSDGVKFRHLEHLERLVLDSCRGFTDLTFLEGFRFQALQLLVLNGSPLTDEGLACIAAHHTRLRFISLSRCRKIADVGLLTLLRGQRLLELLLLDSCNSLTDEFLRELPGDICPRLERVTLVKCFFSDEAMEQLRIERPTLDVLDWDLAQFPYTRSRKNLT